MNNANYYDLSAHSIRIKWYPHGVGGPVRVGGVSGPTLIYNDGHSEVTVSGNDLTIGKATLAGTVVTAVVRKTGIVPGGISTLSVLVPDVELVGDSVPVELVGIEAVHRGTATLGAGQLETYKSIQFRGTAANVALPE
jgi:hypothetical protein